MNPFQFESERIILIYYRLHCGEIERERERDRETKKEIRFSKIDLIR